MSRRLPLDQLPPDQALPVTPAAPSGWPLALALLGAGLLGLGVLFFEEGAAAVRVWENSETYNHCWLVLPIAAWLAWTRRDRLAGLPPQPNPAFALLALPIGLAWLAAERLGIMEGRQLTVVALLPVLVLSVLGWRVARAMAAPLAYLFFLVPFGAFTTPMLQTITARMVDLGLDVVGIPHYVDELIIETPAGTFLVAEACAGLRFLIAAIAFGALYALVMFRSPGRRLAVMALAVVVPIFANGLRALGIVVLGSYLGSAEAAAADHILYGWIFFSIVMLLLILAGLPFREDGPVAAQPAAAPRAWPAPSPVALAVTAIVATGLAAAAPVVALSLNQAGARAPQRSAVALAAVEGCAPAPGEAMLRCGDYTLAAEAVVFPAQATWRLVAAEMGRLSGGDQDIQFTVRAPGAAWRARQLRGSGETVAMATFLNGQPTGSGIRARIEQAWNSLGGGRGRPVMVTIALRPPTAGQLAHAPRQRAVVEAVLQAQGEAIASRAAALSGPVR
ncbi:exosortase A [Falsiroseomonas sp.]|uniref:exosortase A n=1 Tax=Falsiroseomonas sp. TaxID=2870721 RepID=UPI00356591FE